MTDDDDNHAIVTAAAAADANDDADADVGAGGAAVHCVLRNAATCCSLEAKTRSFTFVLHAR